MGAAASLGGVVKCSRGLLHRPSLFSLLVLLSQGAHVATAAAPQLRRLTAHLYFYKHNSNMIRISSPQCVGLFLMKWCPCHRGDQAVLSTPCQKHGNVQVNQVLLLQMCNF